MDKVIISDEAYSEFISFLKENEIDEYNIRINFAGFACSGPAFNISVEEEKEGDIVEKVKDVKFVFNKDLIEEFGGFVILSTEENDGRGLSLKPLLEQEGGCSTCGGCH